MYKYNDICYSDTDTYKKFKIISNEIEKLERTIELLKRTHIHMWGTLRKEGEMSKKDFEEEMLTYYTDELIHMLEESKK